MNQVNVIFAVSQTTWDLLKQNFQRDENGDRLRTDLTDSQAKKLKSNVSGHWKAPNIGGTNYRVVSWYVPEIYADSADRDVGTKESGLKWVEFLTNKWTGKFHIIGAWHSDGSMFGTEITRVENGTDAIENRDRVITLVDKEVIDIDATIANGVETFKTIQVEEISYVPNGTFTDVPHYDTVADGAPVYPIHAQHMKIFPDDVSYDADGNETSRAPASAPKEVNKMSGWKNRRWV